MKKFTASTALVIIAFVLVGLVAVIAQTPPAYRSSPGSSFRDRFRERGNRGGEDNLDLYLNPRGTVTTGPSTDVARTNNVALTNEELLMLERIRDRRLRRAERRNLRRNNRHDRRRLRDDDTSDSDSDDFFDGLELEGCRRDLEAHKARVAYNFGGPEWTKFSREFRSALNALKKDKDFPRLAISLRNEVDDFLSASLNSAWKFWQRAVDSGSADELFALFAKYKPTQRIDFSNMSYEGLVNMTPAQALWGTARLIFRAEKAGSDSKWIEDYLPKVNAQLEKIRKDAAKRGKEFLDKPPANTEAARGREAILRDIMAGPPTNAPPGAGARPDAIPARPLSPTRARSDSPSRTESPSRAEAPPRTDARSPRRSTVY